MPVGGDYASWDGTPITDRAPGARHRRRCTRGHDKLHDLMVTQDFYDSLPKQVREHLICRTVEKLVPVTQKHDIEGLVMG